VDVPRPGTLTFHFTFFVSLHSIGGSPVGETPFINGPRHAGQFWSAVDAAAAKAALDTTEVKMKRPTIIYLQ
jgi:hypothetical protein